MARRKKLPEEVERQLNQAIRALNDLVEAENPGEALKTYRWHVEAAAEKALRTHWRELAETVHRTLSQTTLSDVIKHRIRESREKAGWTQRELANAMDRLGFEWKRLTVTEIERPGARKVSFEELLGLAILFSRPIVEFMVPEPHEQVRLTESWYISGDETAELIVGPQDGGDATWDLPARLVGSDSKEADWRPAWDYFDAQVTSGREDVH